MFYKLQVHQLLLHKMINKVDLSSGISQSIVTEVSIMQELSHPNIVKIEDLRVTSESLEFYKRDQDFHEKWSSLTEEEKWNFYEKDRFRYHSSSPDRTYVTDVFIMSTPKFDSEDTSETYDVSRFLENKDCAHKYSSSATYDIVAERNPYQHLGFGGYC